MSLAPPILSDLQRTRRRWVAAWLATLSLTGGLFLLWAELCRHSSRPPLWVYLLGLPWALLYALVSVHTRYLCRAFPLRSGHIGKALWVQLQVGLLLALAWAWAAEQALAHWAGGGRMNFQILLPAGLGLYCLAVAVNYTMESLQSAQAAQQAVAEARIQAREAELRALRAQVNPHFLFNSLHSISALAGSDPARARQMCLHLSELYRLTLGLGLRDSITLADELAVLRAYIAVESVRFGSRLRYQEQVPEPALELTLPALLLQPLVENAMKHGIAGLAEPGDLLLRAQVTAGRLRLELANDFDPDAPHPRASGHGLDNIRRRLAAFYGASGEPARLDLERREHQFIARLDLPARLAEAALPAL